MYNDPNLKQIVDIVPKEQRVRQPFQQYTPIPLIRNFMNIRPLMAKKAVEKANETNSSLLTDLFRTKIASMGLAMNQEATPDVLYPTGFPLIDYLNGYIAQELDPLTGQLIDYYNTGITDGSYVALVSNTNTGKSTFANQLIANIARPFPNSSIFIDDIESGMTDVRRRFLSKFPTEEYDKRYIVRNSGVTAENLYKRIKYISDIKTKERPNDFLYDTGRRDIHGKPIIKMQPTLYLVDSIAALMPENMVDDEELTGKSYGAQVASVMAQLFQMIIQLLKAANIILIGINHFSQDIQMGPFKKPPEVPWLKEGERIPKGRKATLLANNIYRLDNSTKLNIDEGYKIEGSIVKFSLVKSRSSGIKKPVKMVFEFINGFDPWLSMLEYLRENKMLYGAGASLSFEPERLFKFSFATFKDKINNDDAFREAFRLHMLPILRSIPREVDRTETADMHFKEILHSFY